MRRLIFPALILLPVLAHAQAKTQTSTLTASQSTASAATLDAKVSTPHVLPAPAAKAATASATPAAAADSGTEIMVPVRQTVVERSSGDVNTNNSTISHTFSNGISPVTAPKLIKALPLTLSLRDMESESAEARVVLQLTVDLAGIPENVKVIHSGGAALDKRALESVNQYRFKPATENNIPVEAPVTIEIKVKKS
jgi:TonB family protein